MTEFKLSFKLGFDGTAVNTGLDASRNSVVSFRQAAVTSGESIATSFRQVQTTGTAVGTTFSQLNGQLAQNTAAVAANTAAVREQAAAQLEASRAAAAAAAARLAATKTAAAGLGDLEKRTVAVGMSAKATAAALRQVPAQFTDIVVSLQAGQSPLTVLLQQGGQLKDVFGGVGPAVQALGGYIAGLINPFTVVTGLALAVAVALVAGQREGAAYSRAIIISGNAAGTTSDKLQQYARNISAVAGTQGAAAEALATIAQSGSVADARLQQAADAAVRFEKATGQAVGETAKQFTELAKSPLEASVKLNERYNFLTASVYEQIKALQEQGKATEAANLAQTTFADTLKNRSSEILQNVGFIEKRWLAVKAAIGGVVDATLNLGREATAGDKINEMNARLVVLKTNLQDYVSKGFGENDRLVAGVRKEIALLEERRSKIIGNSQAEEEAAAKRAKSNAATQLKTEFDKDGEKFVSNQIKLRKELTAETERGEKLIAAGLLKRSQLEERLAAIKQKYRDTSGESALENALSAELALYKGYADDRTAILAGAEKSAESLRKQGLLDERQLADALFKLRDDALVDQIAIAELSAATAGGKKQKAEQQRFIGEVAKLNTQRENNERAHADRLAEIDAEQSKRIRDKITEWELESDAAKKALAIELSLYGATAEARAVALAGIKLETEAEKLIADAKRAGIPFSAAQAEAIRAEAAARGQNASAIAGEQQALAGAQQLREANRRFAAESILDEDARARALLEIDADVWRQRIALAGEGTEAQKRLIDEFTIYYQNQLDKPFTDRWKATVERFDTTFREGFTRLLEGGKDKWSAFNKSILNAFKTEVADQIYRAFLKPFVVNIIGNFLGIEGGAANAGGANSLSGIVSNVSSLNSAYKFLNGGYQQIAGYLGFGATAATGLGLSAAGTAAGGFATGLATTGLGAGVAGTGLGLSTGAAGLGLSAGSAGAGAIGAGLGTSAAAGGAAAGGAAAGTGSLYASAAAAGPYVVAALAVLNALGVFRSKKIVDGGLQGELGGQVNDYALQRKGGTLFSGPSYRVLDQGASAQNQALQDSYNAIRNSVAGMAEQLGVGNDAIKAFTVRLGNDLIHPDTGGFGIKTQGLSQEEIIAKIEAALLSANEQLAAFALGTTEFTRDGETAVQTLGRLSGSLGSFNSVFKTLGLKLADASLASADAASKFIDSFGGADQFAQVANSFYQNFYTEAERTANTVEALRQRFFELGTAGATTREGFRDLVEETVRLNGATSPVVAELLKLESTFASVVPAIDAVTQAAAQQAEQAQQQAAAIASERSDRLRAERELAASAKAAAEEVSKLNEQNYRLAISAGNIGKAIASSSQTGPRFADYQGLGGFNAAGYNAANIAAQQRSYQQVLADTQRQNPFEVADYFGVISELQRNIASLTDNLNSGEFNGGSSSIEQAAQQAFGGFLNPEQIQAAADGLTSFSNVLSLVSGTAAQGAIGADQALRVLEGAYTGAARQSVEYARGLEIIGQSVGVATGNLQDIQAAIQSGLDYFNSGEYYQAIAQEQLRVQVQFTSRAFTALTQRAASFNVETGNLETSFDVLDGFIGRLKSVQDAFANAAGDRAAEAGLISDAARRIGEIITTPVAEAARNALADLPSFADVDGSALRDISLLLKDLGQFNNPGLEQTFIRVSDALASGVVSGAQYADLIEYIEDVYLGTATALDTVGESAANAANAMREREGLELRLLQLQGNTAELRRRELEALDPSNRAYQQYIWMVEEAMKVADAFDTVRQAARSLSSQLLLDQSANAFGQQSAVAEASRQYRETLAGAFEGDTEAASALAGVTKTYLELQLQTASTELDYRRTFATTLADLDRLQKAQAVGLAGVQLPTTPDASPLGLPLGDLPATPVVYNTSNQDATPTANEMRAMQAELVALRQLVARLVAVTETNLPAVAEHTAATQNVLKRVTRNGTAVATTEVT